MNELAPSAARRGKLPEWAFPRTAMLAMPGHVAPNGVRNVAIEKSDGRRRPDCSGVA